ncbi:MAG: hypothetical protein WBM02_11085 [bacterium]
MRTGFSGLYSRWHKKNTDCLDMIDLHVYLFASVGLLTDDEGA